MPGDEALYNLGTYIANLFYSFLTGIRYSEERGDLGKLQELVSADSSQCP